MTTICQTHEDPSELWNGEVGHAWVARQSLLDTAFKGLEDLIVEEVFAGPGGRVLDVGCGTGSTTLAIAETLGSRGHCVGVDVSQPMLAHARARAAASGSRAEFIHADAGSYPFEDSSFDMIVSRFGVMFFEEPVRAFANLRRAARPGADVRILAWRSSEENAFMTAAERAARPIIAGLPDRSAKGPGQFAFADRSFVQHMLEKAGWDRPSVRPVDVPCSFPEEELVSWATSLGPVGRLLGDLDEPRRSCVTGAVLEAFSQYLDQGKVRFQAACWLISAQSGDVSREPSDV